MLHLIVVLTDFHECWHMCYLWKTVETTFQCIVVLQSQGDGPKIYYNFLHPGSQSGTYVIISIDNRGPFIVDFKTFLKTLSDSEPCLGCAFVYMNHPAKKCGVCRGKHSANKYLVSIPKYTQETGTEIKILFFLATIKQLTEALPWCYQTVSPLLHTTNAVNVSAKDEYTAICPGLPCLVRDEDN